jgi:D-inositol-3-phosphate glycosyltransferase
VRILVISNLYPDRRQPTFGTFVRAHVNALRRAGAEVHVAAIRGVPVHTAVLWKYTRLLFRATRLVLARMRHGVRPQVVEAHLAYPTGLIAWPLARICGARLVLYCHGADVREAGLRSRLHRSLSGLVFRRADLLVANSRSTSSVLTGTYGIAPERIVIWSPGIDTDLFRPMPSVKRAKRRLLYAGNLTRQKGIHVLLEAMAQVRDCELSARIVGVGSERDRLEASARAMDLAVTFVGGLPPAGVAFEMAQAGVLVVPSISEEGLGLVALEGMATGALVIASRAGGLAEIVEDGVNAWLVPPGDAAALAERIRHAFSVLADPNAAQGIRRAAAARAAEHDVYAMARMEVAAYETLLAGGLQAAGNA